MRPVTMAPSHSRTYRSSSEAAAAICSEVEGGRPAIVSKRPVRCPMLVISVTAAALRLPMTCPANASDFASSIRTSVAISHPRR